MLYLFAKILMTTGLRFFYRHIHVTGLENIPAKGPAIIIANHPSSLMDAALIGILLKRPIHFFARGDVFINKPVRRLLSWFHMMPIHQHSVDRHKLGINDDSFSDGQEIISQGGVIVFFPESTSHPQRQLLAFRKGVFRLAFKTAAAHNFSFEIPIIPLGITYDNPVEPGKSVQVHAGRPLLLSSYKAYFESHPSACLLRICKEANEVMQKEVLHVANKNRLEFVECCLTIKRNNSITRYSSWKIASKKKLEEEQNICDKVNWLNEQQFEPLERVAAAYADTLEQHELEDRTLSPSFRQPNKIFLGCSFPLYLLGVLLNAPPVFLSRRLANKKVTRKDFYSWIFVATYSLMYFIWIILLTIITLFFGWKYVLGILAVMIITGIFAYHYTGWWKAASQERKLRRLSPKEITQLKNQRNIVLNAFK